MAEIKVSEPMQNALYVLRRWGPHSADAICGLSGDTRITMKTMRALVRRDCVERHDGEGRDIRFRLTRRGKLVVYRVVGVRPPPSQEGETP